MLPSQLINTVSKVLDISESINDTSVKVFFQTVGEQFVIGLGPGRRSVKVRLSEIFALLPLMDFLSVVNEGFLCLLFSLTKSF